MTKIYKYFSHSVLELVFQRDGFCGVKCSLPKDYNDPYELFLGVDTSLGPELLATYNEIIEELPQLPTTCFSKSPVVAPMWAHYANDHSGFVLEFDTASLHQFNEANPIRDVTYRDVPEPGLADLLAKAAFARKPRHAFWLQQAVFDEAYFSKLSSWSYEQECRLIDVSEAVENVAGNDILYVPSKCVTAIIVGNKVRPEVAERSKEIAEAFDLGWHELRVGRSSPVPFVQGRDGTASIFQSGQLSLADYICAECSEPVHEAAELCAWCAITQAHQDEAASGNPYRILDRYGLLEDYIKTASKIGRKP